MSKRTVEQIESDINKLNDLMSALSLIGDGYTIRQKISHHKEMASLLEELLDFRCCRRQDVSPPTW